MTDRLPAAYLKADPAAQPVGQVMDEGGRRMRHAGQVDVTRSLASHRNRACSVQTFLAKKDAISIHKPEKWIDKAMEQETTSSITHDANGFKKGHHSGLAISDR